MKGMDSFGSKNLIWILLVILTVELANGEAPPLGLSVVTIVETLIERTVALPCKATLHPEGDTPNLLLFYRHSSNIPFYSYDARTGDFWRAGNSKTRDTRYEGRVSLNLTQPQIVHLNLNGVALEDEGDFTCRVDFLSSPSLTSIVKLKVYANPSLGPTVSVGLGPRGTPVRAQSDVGPFYEGEKLNLSCTVTGGHPLPLVTWWQESVLLDNSSFTVNKNGPMETVNELVIGPLTRELVEMPFKCRSINNPLSPPIDSILHIKIHMAPQSVVLKTSATIRAGLEERLQCLAKDSYPEANITWTLNGHRLNFTTKETRQVGSDTVSSIHFISTPKENGAILTCTASSSTLPDPPISTNATLNVTHSPLVRLQFGSSLRPDHIRQGDDVYFDCLIVSNPPEQRIAWFKEEREVWQDKTAGILVGGTNLVLQSVQRPDAGRYTCTATNAVGTTRSNSLTLSIQYGPMCKQGRLTVTALEGEVVTLQCTVDAYPSNVTFNWLFNNTVDSTNFRENEYTVNGSVSRLRYVAYSARDFGTIFCWASNLVGRQDDPCAFILQPAGAPDSVYDCVLTNQSAGSLHITCKSGADGGLTQTFRAEVYTGGAAKPVRVLEGMSPVFTLEGLAPGGDYVVTVTAMNRKGSSPPISLQAFTLKVAENRMISPSPSMAVSGVSSSQPEPENGAKGALSPLLAVFLGIVGAFLLLTAAAIFITRRHCYKSPGRTPDLVAGQELEVKEEASGVMSRAKGNHADDSDLAESDPFLEAPECYPASMGVVFTIPAHIPPPPQYCNDLSPKHHAQDQIQKPFPLRDQPSCFQAPSSSECGHIPFVPNQSEMQGGTFHLPSTYHLPNIYTTGLDAPLRNRFPDVSLEKNLFPEGPQPGLFCEAPRPQNCGQCLGLVPGHLGEGIPPPQGALERPEEAHLTQSSPESRAKRVTWLSEQSESIV